MLLRFFIFVPFSTFQRPYDYRLLVSSSLFDLKAIAHSRARKNIVSSCGVLSTENNVKLVALNICTYFYEDRFVHKNSTCNLRYICVITVFATNSKMTSISIQQFEYKFTRRNNVNSTARFKKKTYLARLYFCVFFSLPKRVSDYTTSTYICYKIITIHSHVLDIIDNRTNKMTGTLWTIESKQLFISNKFILY